jgi:hypothetical protein
MGAYLGFVESIPFDFLVKSLGDSSSLEDAVLTVEKPVLKGELCEGEADDEALPWEERPVEPAGQALNCVSNHALNGCRFGLTWRIAWIMAVVVIVGCPRQRVEDRSMFNVPRQH